MASATLEAIRTKVRRLTHTPSTDLMTDAQLDEYINTFIQYDFPEHLRLFSLRTLLTFYTQPGVDTYATNTVDTNSPLFNFKNRYVAIHPPIFIAGIQAFFTQWRDVFYAGWPQTNSIIKLPLSGNGGPGPFTGTLTQPNPPFPFILAGSVNFNCVDTSGVSMILVDYPQYDINGNQTQTAALGIPGQPQTLPSPFGQLNYATGAFTLNFPGNTQPLSPIYFEGILYQPGKPTSVLYYDNKFILRPVPDKVYTVQIEADIRPTELLLFNDVPQLEQWWQYVSYGASVKVFQDRMDLDSVQMIMPEFKQQERLVLRTTLVQQANERTTTIYTQGRNYGIGWFGSQWPY